MGGCAQVICKYNAILYKGLGHLQILVWEMCVLEPIPLGNRVTTGPVEQLSFTFYPQPRAIIYLLSVFKSVTTQIPHITGIIQYLFCDWLISFSMMFSTFIHVTEFPFLWWNNISLCVCVYFTLSLSIHALMNTRIAFISWLL